MSCLSDCFAQWEADRDACQQTYPSLSGVFYELCLAKADTAYALCVAKCAARAVGEIVEDAAESVADAFARAARWLADHPEVVIGTIIVVGVVTFVVVSGGSGAPALALVAV